MPISRKLIPVLAIAAGVLLGITGISLIFVYVNSAIEVWNLPDQSALFWYLPFLFFGFISVAGGIYFLFIGIKAFKTSQYRKITSASLIILLALIVVISALFLMQEYRAEQHRADIAEYQELFTGLQKIDQLTITNDDTGGIVLTIDTKGNHSDIYQLKITVHNNQAEFKEIDKEILLNSNSNRLTEYILFDDLFDKCRDGFRNTGVYVCVEGAGTSNSEFKISAALQSHLLDQDYPNHFDSSKKTASFFLDTINNNGTVQVTSVRTEKSQR